MVAGIDRNRGGHNRRCSQNLLCRDDVRIVRCDDPLPVRANRRLDGTRLHVPDWTGI